MNTIKVGDRVFVSELQRCGNIVARTTTGAVPAGVCGVEHHELFNGWFRVQLDRDGNTPECSDVFMPGELQPMV